MTKIALSTNQAGQGSITLAAPNTNSDNTFTFPDATGTAMLTDTGVTTSQLPTGTVLQVVQAIDTDHYYSNSTSYIDLIEASITPSSSSSKVLITATLAVSKDNNHSFLGRVVRDGSAISGAGGANASGSQENGNWWNIRNNLYSPAPYTTQYLDSPTTTSSVTYKAQGKTSDAGQYFGINRAHTGTLLYASPTFSVITLMEIAA